MQFIRCSSTAACFATVHKTSYLRFWSSSYLRLWDATSLDQLYEVRFPRNVRDIAFSPDGLRFVALIASEKVGRPTAKTTIAHLYNIDGGQLLNSRTLANCRAVTCLGNDLVAFGRLGDSGTKGYVDICRLTTLDLVATITLPKYELCFQLAYLPHRKLILSLGIGLAIIDPESHSVTNHVHGDNLQVDWDVWETTCMFAHESTNQVAVGFDTYSGKAGKRICILDAKTWSPWGWYAEESEYPTNVALCSDGRFLATTFHERNFVHIHDVDSKKEVAELSVPGASSIAFLPGTETLLIAGTDCHNPLAVWGIANARDPQGSE